MKTQKVSCSSSKHSLTSSCRAGRAVPGAGRGGGQHLHHRADLPAGDSSEGGEHCGLHCQSRWQGRPDAALLHHFRGCLLLFGFVVPTSSVLLYRHAFRSTYCFFMTNNEVQKHDPQGRCQTCQRSTPSVCTLEWP